MDPQTMMMIQALAGSGGIQRPNPAVIGSQLQMMHKLGSPLYAQSPLRATSSSAIPFANPFNQQAQAAFGPAPQLMQQRQS